MAAGDPAAVAEQVVRLASARPATPGGGRLVCIDGPAGSGKSTLGAQVAARTGAAVVGMDELMEDWAGGVHTESALTALVGAWAAGRSGHYRRYDWHAERFGEQVGVAPAPWLVVEGVGSGPAAIDGLITLLVWVEVDADLRLRRGLVRDGAALEPQWRRFMVEEAGLFARERTRDRADVVVDGTGGRPPVVR